MMLYFFVKEMTIGVCLWRICRTCRICRFCRTCSICRTCDLCKTRRLCKICRICKMCRSCRIYLIAPFFFSPATEVFSFSMIFYSLFVSAFLLLCSKKKVLFQKILLFLYLFSQWYRIQPSLVLLSHISNQGCHWKTSLPPFLDIGGWWSYWPEILAPGLKFVFTTTLFS